MYDIDANKWTEAGILPDYHIVTEQIALTWNEHQTVCVFTQVNFDQNLFEVCVSTNNGITSEKDQVWTWLFKKTVDIANFHIKSACFVDDKIVITARGKPRNVFEQCCSFLLIFKMKTDGNLITGFEDEYNYIKLDPVVYPQLCTKPQVAKYIQSDGYVSLTVIQENNF